MGCSSLSVIDNEPNLRFDGKVKTLIRKKIINNPFYSFPEEQFKKMISTDINNDMNSILNQIESKLKVNKLEIQIAKNVILHAKIQLRGLYPNKQYDYNILMTLYYFLTKQDKTNEDSKKKLILVLIKNTIKENQSDPCLYSTGKFSFLLYNIIQFCLFSFLCLFVVISLLEIEENFDAKDLYELLIEKKETKKIDPLKLDVYINDKIIKVNKNISPHNVMVVFLNEIFKPLANCNDYIN